MAKNIPSIVTECEEYFQKWKLGNITDYSKQQFERMIKKNLARKNMADLLERAKNMKKVKKEDYESSEFKIKEYFKQLNLHDSRTIFRKNSFMLKTVRSNFKSDKRYKAESYLCPDCLTLDPPVSHQDTQEALATCQGNSDLRQGINLNDLKQEAKYYQSITTRRIQKFGG